MNKIICWVVGAAVSIGFVACGRRAEWTTAEGAVWNTTYRITYFGAEELADSVQRVLQQVDNSLSMFNPSSTVSRINAGDSVADPLFTEMFALSQRISRQTSGRFDPTVRPLVELWGFGTDKARRLAAERGLEPSRAEIDSVLAFVGIEGCRLENGKVVRKHPATQFDFSAIAKGYACDLVARMLQRNGVESCLVEIGGEVTAIGKNPRNQPWRLQIDAPIEAQGTPQHERARLVSVSDCGVATSGNYRNFHKNVSGERLGHTLDPQSGRPFQSEIVSATIIAPTCAEADGLATASMASLTAEAARRMFDSIPSLGYLLIVSRNDSLVQIASPNLSRNDN